MPVISACILHLVLRLMIYSLVCVAFLRLSNKSVDALSSFIIITELPVRFVKKLRDKIAMYKHRAYLECQVSRANAKVTWYKNNSEIKPSKKHEIASEDIYRKLTIIDVDADDEDTYVCDAIDDKTSCQLLVEGKNNKTQFYDEITAEFIKHNHTLQTKSCLKLTVNNVIACCKLFNNSL